MRVSLGGEYNKTLLVCNGRVIEYEENGIKEKSVERFTERAL